MKSPSRKDILEGVKRTLSHFRVMATGSGCALVQLQPLTGGSGAPAQPLQLYLAGGGKGVGGRGGVVAAAGGAREQPSGRRQCSAVSLTAVPLQLVNLFSSWSQDLLFVFGVL